MRNVALKRKTAEQEYDTAWRQSAYNRWPKILNTLALLCFSRGGISEDHWFTPNSARLNEPQLPQLRVAPIREPKSPTIVQTDGFLKSLPKRLMTRTLMGLQRTPKSSPSSLRQILKLVVGRSIAKNQAAKKPVFNYVNKSWQCLPYVCLLDCIHLPTRIHFRLEFTH